MKLIQLTRMSEVNKHGRRKQLGLFECKCGVQVERAVSYIKTGSIKQCRPCGTAAAILKRYPDRQEAQRTRAYHNLINNAASRKIEVNVTREELIELMKNPCTYCGSVNKIGVDRIDSNLGYIKQNITPCCKTCNLAKHVMSSTQFIAHCTAVANYNSYLDMKKA
jgi:hypothetical protein